jgi:hypothetical protein
MFGSGFTQSLTSRWKQSHLNAVRTKEEQERNSTQALHLYLASLLRYPSTLQHSGDLHQRRQLCQKKAVPLGLKN